MKTSIEVNIKPFNVPSFVIPEVPAGKKEDGFEPTEGIPLSALDPVTLEKLCDEFRDNVFRRAGKQQPVRAA